MRRKTEVLVGAAVLGGLALIVFGTIWLQGARLGQEEVVVQARFREVGQLLPGNSVKMRGVPIGEVETIELDPGGTGVIVSMRVDDDVRFPPDPVVILSPESMFGDWQAEIFSRNQFPRYNYAESPNPNVLPGYSLPDLSRLTAVADRIAENLAVLTERIEIAFTEETALNIRRAIENIQEVSGQLTGMVGTQQAAVEAIAAELEEVTQTLGEAATTMNQLFVRVDEAVDQGEIEAIVTNVRQTSARIDTLSVELLETSSDLRTTLATVDSILAPAGSVLSRVSRGEGTLGRLVASDSLYLQLLQTNARLEALLADIQANPRKYINLEIF